MEYSESQQKTDLFRMRINPEFRGQLESVFSKTGLSLTDAVNVFFQQSLSAGGIPFSVTADNAALLRAKALTCLMAELEKGKASQETYTASEVYELFGIEQ